MDGISDWHRLDPVRYPLQRQEYFGHDAPPPDPQPGFIYDQQRWNPGWQFKINMFDTNVDWYWHAPRIQVAINKFCYVDYDADPEVYLANMRKLEAEYPTTAFVYTTMCLTSQGDTDDVKRNLYNQKIRSWVATNEVILFDVADIESYSPTGEAASFTADGVVYPMLYPPYSVDGSHMNDTNNLARQRLALGFYALGAALFRTDRNGDGISDGDNLLAGIAPKAAGPAWSGAALRIIPGPLFGTTLALLWVQGNPLAPSDIADFLDWSCMSNPTWRQSLSMVPNSTNFAGFPLILTGLIPGTNYTCQLVKSNASGLAVSNPLFFSTPTQGVVVANPVLVDRPAGQSLTIPVSQLLARGSNSVPVHLEWFSSTSTLGASVSIHGTNLVYVPRLGPDTIDTFFYIVADTGNDIDGAYVTINPRPANSGASYYTRNITSVSITSTDTLVISGMGIPGGSYDVQSTEALALTDWHEIGTVVASVNGTFTYQAVRSLSSATGYYRVVPR
jgi:hypothetical protein